MEIWGYAEHLLENGDSRNLKLLLLLLVVLRQVEKEQQDVKGGWIPCTLNII